MHTLLKRLGNVHSGHALIVKQLLHYYGWDAACVIGSLII